MDRISELPDELLERILSLVPTRVAVSTSILSKRWKFLWMSLPRLDFSSRYCYEAGPAFREFVDKNLPLHRAPVIESLSLDFGRYSHIEPEDIKRWVEIAVSRNVRELEVIYASASENLFPGSFYTCASLVVLALGFVTLMDVPSTVCLPSLKTLSLESVEYPNRESLQLLLSVCPVLEELWMYFHGEHDGVFTVIVPSLQILSLYIAHDLFLEGYVIETPSLKYFELKDQNNMEHHSDIKNMPKLREAYVDLFSHDLKSLIGSITSVKSLTICSEDVYGDGLVFDQLEHLKLCVCKKGSSNLLGQLLKDSPNLRVLDIFIGEYHWTDECDDMGCWNQPSPVPECLLSSLQIFSWSRYFGRPQEREIAVYILRNACRLKTATIMADTEAYHVSNLEMIKELTLSSRASSTCELVFVEDDDDTEDEDESEPESESE